MAMTDDEKIMRLGEVNHYMREVVLPIREDVSSIKGKTKVSLTLENGNIFAEYDEE